MSNYETECEDLNPYPAPAPEFNDPLPEGKPAVPELSVLLDQDRIQPFHSPEKPKEQDLRFQSGMTKQKSNVVTGKDKMESYNTWKARHAEELNMITSSSRNVDTNSKYYSKKSSESKFNTSSANRLQSSKRSSSVSSSSNVDSVRHNMQNYAHQRSPNFVQDSNLSHTSNPYGTVPPREFYQPENVPRYDEINGVNYQNRYLSYGLNGQMQNVGGPPPLIHSQNPNSYQTMNQPHVTSNCNQDMGLQGYPEHPNSSGGVRNLYAPGVLRDGHISNLAIHELYQVVQLQNQQMNAAIIMLQEQVKQLQLSIGAEKNSTIEKDVSKNCSCRDKSSSNSCSSPKMRVGNGSSSKKVQVSPNRSVGVMANISEYDEEEYSETSEVVEESVGRKQAKRSSKHREKQVAKNTSAKKDNKKSPKMLEGPKTSKGKKSYTSLQDKKTSKKQSKKTATRTSNLLQEPKHVRKKAGADEESPNEDCDSSNPSIHINLQDYSSSEKSSSDLRSGSEYSVSLSDSASEEESSCPKLGWTFYNQIVDQVNNIVKKNPAPPKTDRSSGSRKVLPSRRKEDYETENNWSKRVTFHGPPPSSSDDFMMNMMPNSPHYQPILGNQEFRDYQTSGPQERMQDLRMYNVANGNTNMSFTTLRYLERFDLLPSQLNSKRPDQMYQQDYQQPRNFDMKQKKAHPDGYPQTSQSNHRRRSRESRR